MTLKLAPASADELDSSCASIDGTSDATTSSRELLRLPFSCGRKEVYDEDGALVAVLPANDSLANTNISFSGTSTNIKFGPETHFHDAVTVIFPPSNIPKTQNGTLPDIDRVVCEKEVTVIDCTVPDKIPQIKDDSERLLSPNTDSKKPNSPGRKTACQLLSAILIMSITVSAILIGALLSTLFIAHYTKTSLAVSTTPSTPVSTIPATPDPGLFVPREHWGGVPPLHTTPVPPAKLIVVKHTGGDVCVDVEACRARVRAIQKHHMEACNYPDIGYNFLIGGDGRIYVGRGFHVKNDGRDDSMDIAFIGNFSKIVPADDMLRLAIRLVRKAHSPNVHAVDYATYHVVNHNQTERTDSPGAKLFEIVTKWDHYLSKILYR